MIVPLVTNFELSINDTMQAESTQLNFSLSQLPVLSQATELPGKDENLTSLISPDASKQKTTEDLISLRSSKRAQKKADTLERAEGYRRAVGELIDPSRLTIDLLAGRRALRVEALQGCLPSIP